MSKPRIMLFSALALCVGVFLIVLANNLRHTGKCSNNLRIISQALFLYGANNGNVYPANLNLLVDANLLTTEILQCPQVDGANDMYMFFVGGRGVSEIGSNDIIVLEAAPNHEGGGNAIVGDGTVVYLDGSEFSRVQRAATQPTILPSLNWLSGVKNQQNQPGLLN